MKFRVNSLLCLFLPFSVLPVFGAGCEAAVGQWQWFNGGVISIQPNQTIVAGGKPAGKWECTNAGRGNVTMRWSVGYIDILTVTGDRLSGKNQQGAAVSGTRINTRTNQSKTGK